MSYSLKYLLLVFTDTLPLGSYCSFELGSCGWTVYDTQSSWNLASGEQLARNTDLLGTTLRSTQGEWRLHLGITIFFVYLNSCYCKGKKYYLHN